MLDKYNLEKVHSDLRKMGLAQRMNVHDVTNMIERSVREFVVRIGGDAGMLSSSIRLDEINEDTAFDLRKSITNYYIEWLTTIAMSEISSRNGLRLARAAQSQHEKPGHKSVRGMNFVSCSCGFHATIERDKWGMAYLFRIDYETKARARIYSPLDKNITADQIHDAIEYAVGHCDKCGRDDKQVRSIVYTTLSDPQYGDSSGTIHLCKGCFNVEMGWRTKRNRKLERKAFSVFDWDEQDDAAMVQSYHDEISVDERGETSQ